MKDITKHYSNGDITVVWKPALCMHSTHCWKDLGNVFNPKKSPWIHMNGAWTEEIIAQVEKCPSGALTYERNNAIATPGEDVVAQRAVVEVTPNGPLIVQADIVIKMPDGSTIERQKTTAFCRCGASGNKPFCDGSHIKTGFKGE